MKVLNYGVIGCGMMGQEHIRNIALLPGARVAAIHDPDDRMLQTAIAMLPDARVHGTVSGLLSQADLDCILIASPNHLHVAQLQEIAATRPLPLLIEKPLYADPADAGRITGLGSVYPAPIWVAMEYRYMPPVAKFIEEAEAATGGIRMLTIREHRFPFLSKVGNWNRFNRNSGGTLVEKCCHFFDLMRCILKDEPVRVMASAGQEVNHLDERYDGEVPDIWDTAYVIVEFARGARAMLELCMYAEGATFQEEISAVGPAGKIECRVPGPARFWPSHLGVPPAAEVIVSPRHPKGPKTVEVQVDPTILAAGDHNGSTYYQHALFQRVVRGEGSVEVTLEDGARAVAIGHAAQDSARTGQAVRIEERPERAA